MREGRAGGRGRSRPAANACSLCQSGFRRDLLLRPRFLSRLKPLRQRALPKRLRRLFALFCLGVAALGLAAALGRHGALAAEAPPPVAALLSREIRPYVLAVDALEAALHRPVSRLYLEDGPAAVSATLEDFLRRGAVFAAVGLDALETLSRLDPPPPMVALMVITPPRPPRPGAPTPSAVVLGIPLEEQLRRIGALFPRVRSVAMPVPFAPSEGPSGAPADASPLIGPAVRRFVVAHPADWDRFFAVDAAEADAVLFVPHPMLASTALIRHGVAQCLLRKKIPIGYNAAFHEAGAAMSFLVDAAGVGREGARLVEALGHGQTGLVVTAPYRVRLKEKTLRHLGLSVPQGLEGDVEVQP